MAHYKISEHVKIEEEDFIKILEPLSVEIKEPDPKKFLGVTKYLDVSGNAYKTYYYIGSCWLNEKNSFSVMPKFENIDFQTMFMRAFESNIPHENNKFSEIFFIDDKQPPIAFDNANFKITPILIVYYLQIINLIVKKGLKKNYIIIEDNLKNKIKGKIQFTQNLKCNFARGRKNRVCCSYQEYSDNCIENRILKRALLFAKQYIYKHIKNFDSCQNEMFQQLNSSLCAFANVDENFTKQEQKSFKINPIYKEYKTALNLADLLLNKIKNYAIQQDELGEKTELFPPFYINMPLLFEYYVYALLYEKYGNQIGYQISTTGNKVDFVKYNSGLIIDTKYKFDWANGDKIHDDIRQLSGYARNIAIRKIIFKRNPNIPQILPCLIIYPLINSESDKLQKIKEYKRFYKLAVRLPEKGKGER